MNHAHIDTGSMDLTRVKKTHLAQLILLLLLYGEFACCGRHRIKVLCGCGDKCNLPLTIAFQALNNGKVTVIDSS